jgi:drug/metabolite transporter (DMT)-like permease
MTGKTKGTLLVLVCVSLWGLIPVVAKLGQSSLDNHQFLFWSSLVSFIVLTSTAVFKGNYRLLRTISIKQGFYLAFLGLLGTYFYYLFLYLGYASAVGMEVLVVQYSWPILIVVLSLVILRERLSPHGVVAIALGFIGVTIVLTQGQFDQINVSNPRVILLVAAGAFCFALFSVLSKKIKFDSTLVVSIYFLSASLASLSSMAYFSEFVVPQSSDWLPILLNGVLVNGFSYLFWIQALKISNASYLAPFTYLAPVLSAIYLVLFFDEKITVYYLVGLVCVISGGLVNTLAKSGLKESRPG